MENDYTDFEKFSNKQGKYLYDQDEIIIEKLRNERLEAIRVEKEKRSIEPKGEASFANRNVLQQEGFKPE